MPRSAPFPHQARALLFDMDGTLVDSTAVVEKIWLRFAARYDLDGQRVLASIHGRKAEDSVAALAPTGVDVVQESARLTAEEVADTEGVIAMPGAASLLASLPENACALVTSAPRQLAEVRMRAAGLPLPKVMVCGEDVSRGKPDPQGYLRAARLLGVPAASCVVFEDAEVGLQAGLAAGMQVVAIGNTLPLAQRPRTCWLRDYRALTVEEADGQLRLHICAAPLAVD